MLSAYLFKTFIKGGLKKQDISILCTNNKTVDCLTDVLKSSEEFKDISN